MTVDGLIEFYQQWLEESLKQKVQGFDDGIDVEITMLETFLNHLHILNGDDRKSIPEAWFQTFKEK